MTSIEISMLSAVPGAGCPGRPAPHALIDRTERRRPHSVVAATATVHEGRVSHLSHADEALKPAVSGSRLALAEWQGPGKRQYWYPERERAQRGDGTLTSTRRCLGWCELERDSKAMQMTARQNEHSQER